MRERIWAELTQTKHNTEFLALYSDSQRNILRSFNIGILIFSTGGAMGWSFWDKLPILACIIIAVVSLLRLVQPHIIMTDKLLNNLDRINVFYTEHYNQLEKLWFDFDTEHINATEASDRFYQIQDSENDLTAIIDETIRQKPKRLVRKAKEYSDLYFKQIFFTNLS